MVVRGDQFVEETFDAFDRLTPALSLREGLVDPE